MLPLPEYHCCSSMSAKLNDHAPCQLRFFQAQRPRSLPPPFLPQHLLCYCLTPLLEAKLPKGCDFLMFCPLTNTQHLK